MRPNRDGRNSRQWILGLGLLILAIGIVPAWRNGEFVYRLSRGRKALQAQDFSDAIVQLERACRLRQAEAGARYLLAVAYRRSGQVDQVASHLDAAERLGWPESEVQLQRLLIRAQIGRFREVEQELRKYFDRGASDETALEVYEALAQGYWTDHDLSEAMRCLDFWIDWRPADVSPRLMKAEIFNNNEDELSAEREYRQVLDLNSRHGVAREALGRLLLKRGQVDEAVHQLRQCLDEGHDSIHLRVALAECEFRLGNAEVADRMLSQVDYAVLAPEEQAEVLKLMADIARFNRNHEQAVKLLEQALDIWPHNSGVHEILGQSYAAIGKRELAAQHLELCREINERGQRFRDLQRDVIKRPTDPEVRFRVGEVLLEQGFPEDAAGWWRSALRCDRYHQASHESLGNYHAERGDVELTKQHRRSAQLAAEVTFRRAWAAFLAGDLETVTQGQRLLAPYEERRAHADLLQAGLLAKEQKHAEAIELLARPLADPGLRSLAVLVQAECMIGQGQLSQAEPLLLEVLTQHPDEINATRWLAVLYYDLGAIDQAEFYLQRVSELDPTDYRVHRLLGLMYKDYEKYADAVVHYRESIRRNPVQPTREEVLVELAECLIKLLKHDEALEVLQQCQASLEQQALRAECLFHTGQHELAVKIAEQICIDQPKHLQAMVLLSDAAMLDRNYVRAAELLREAISESPFDHAAHHKLARALSHLEDRADEAAQVTRRAEELKAEWQRFSEMHKHATAHPHDIEVRRELAVQAEKLGRDDLAEVWRRAVRGLQRVETEKEQ